ncbi:MAG: V-type ATP synthase subunit E [bacterium]|nr:V-type ATP synthase subunit E [bacterium]
MNHMESELLKLIENEAQAEQQRILDAARQGAKDILDKARSQTVQMKEAQEVLLASENNIAAVKAQSAVHLEASALILSAKDRIISGVFAEAAQQLNSLSGAQLKQALKNLMAEACSQFGPGMVVTVKKEDLALAQQVVKELKLDAKLEADPLVKDGVIVSNPDRTSVVLNRFADRMARAKPALTSSLAQILWG